MAVCDASACVCAEVEAVGCSVYRKQKQRYDNLKAQVDAITKAREPEQQQTLAAMHKIPEDKKEAEARLQTVKDEFNRQASEILRALKRKVTEAEQAANLEQYDIKLQAVKVALKAQYKQMEDAKAPYTAQMQEAEEIMRLCVLSAPSVAEAP